MHPASGDSKHDKNPSLELTSILVSYYWANDVCLTIREGWLRTSGTTALTVENGFLFSLMQPRHDFFMFVIILQTPGMKNLDCMCMCESTWRRSLPCHSSGCASFMMYFANMDFL